MYKLYPIRTLLDFFFDLLEWRDVKGSVEKNNLFETVYDLVIKLYDLVCVMGK